MGLKNKRNFISIFLAKGTRKRFYLGISKFTVWQGGDSDYQLNNINARWREDNGVALKKCKECGKKVSDKAQLCPNCGTPNPIPTLTPSQKHTKKPKWNDAVGLTVLILIILSIVTIIGSYIIDREYTSGLPKSDVIKEKSKAPPPPSINYSINRTARQGFFAYIDEHSFDEAVNYATE
jgi:hypothetical protein